MNKTTKWFLVGFGLTLALAVIHRIGLAPRRLGTGGCEPQ